MWKLSYKPKDTIMQDIKSVPGRWFTRDGSIPPTCIFLLSATSFPTLRQLHFLLSTCISCSPSLAFPALRHLHCSPSLALLSITCISCSPSLAYPALVLLHFPALLQLHFPFSCSPYVNRLTHLVEGHVNCKDLLTTVQG